MENSMNFSGELSIKLINRKGPGLRWHLKNRLRWAFIWGWFLYHLAQWFSKMTGVVTMVSELELVKISASGQRIHYGVVGYRVITDAGVAFIVDDWDNNTTDLTTFNYHGVGTGTNAEAAGDTALQTESTTALNPDSTRATGTKSQPAANQLRSVGTLTFDASAAITEHGLLSQSATGGGTLWDRTVFSAVNVVSGDSLQCTYTCTLSSGG